MSMLDRIKKRQLDGLKDFVESIEVTGALQRQQIVMNGILEDPIFMRWVTRNVRTFDDFLKLSSDEIDLVVRASDAMLSVIAKALPVLGPDDVQKYEECFPRVLRKLRDEVSFLKDVPAPEREAAQFFVLKTVRKLQREEAIAGFAWHLPPAEVFQEQASAKEGTVSISFEDGTVALEGEVLRGKRIGIWRHYYDNGRLLAEGNYQEGVKTGPWRFYFGNGDLRSEGKYLNDLRHGVWKEYDRTGEVRVSEWSEGKKV